MRRNIKTSPLARIEGIVIVIVATRKAVDSKRESLRQTFKSDLIAEIFASDKTVAELRSLVYNRQGSKAESLKAYLEACSPTEENFFCQLLDASDLSTDEKSAIINMVLPGRNELDGVNEGRAIRIAQALSESNRSELVLARALRLAAIKK